MSATYTHVGGRAAVGYQHCGKHFNHHAKAAGRRHALNASGYRQYRSLCGVTVREDSDDQHDQGGRNTIYKASVGKITCKQCLARKPQIAAPTTRTESRLWYESAEGVTLYATGRRSEIEWFEPGLRARGATRVWIEEVTITTTY